ncbi:ubiquitin-like protein 4A-A [Polyodon spathula]|uniref:ubiquitin-like protein 4A-A n=1 Tax=Polyodon spathula TaxID=7913 RepID=UPI001B7EE3EA|nr:ubiquitin-like protein 4A-A [Polyodon spathula]
MRSGGGVSLRETSAFHAASLFVEGSQARRRLLLFYKDYEGQSSLNQVCEDEKVSTVWSLVSEKLNIPVNQQGLLYKGKALAGLRAEPALVESG